MCQIVAFAVFSDQASALAAKETLNGIKFDLQTGATLHIELAKSNSRTKRLRTDDVGATLSEKKYRGPLGVPNIYADTVTGIGGTMHIPGMVHSVHSDISGFTSSQSGGVLMPTYAGQDSLSSMAPSIIPSPPVAGSNPPCSTLFVANLGPGCTEEELTQVLARFPGYRRIKMQTKGGLPVAFVEFQDVGCSSHALNQLQNSMLHSSDKGGMRLEYAKARMGQPRRERSFLSSYPATVAI